MLVPPEVLWHYFTEGVRRSIRDADDGSQWQFAIGGKTLLGSGDSNQEGVLGIR